jgi:hypothetical protein
MINVFDKVTYFLEARQRVSLLVLVFSLLHVDMIVRTLVQRVCMLGGWVVIKVRSTMTYGHMNSNFHHYMT